RRHTSFSRDWSSDVCSSDLELHEEVGLRPEHVRILGRTRDWLRYNVPNDFIRRDSRGIYKGQKQIWFLLRMVGRDSDVSLRATRHPEFDAWRWSHYWVPLDAVIEFKREDYTQALNELAGILFRRGHETRDLRQRGHAQRNGAEKGQGEAKQLARPQTERFAGADARDAMPVHRRARPAG